MGLLSSSGSFNKPRFFFEKSGSRSLATKKMAGFLFDFSLDIISCYTQDLRVLLLGMADSVVNVR